MWCDGVNHVVIGLEIIIIGKLQIWTFISLILMHGICQETKFNPTDDLFDSRYALAEMSQVLGSCMPFLISKTWRWLVDEATLLFV